MPLSESPCFPDELEYQKQCLCKVIKQEAGNKSQTRGWARQALTGMSHHIVHVK